MKGANKAMNKLKKFQAGLTAALFIFTAVSCSSSKKVSSSEQQTTTAEAVTQPTEQPTEKEFHAAETNEKMTLTWLGDYDLNPYGDEKKSTALSLFEDVYGGKINYHNSYANERFTILEMLLDSGETVDMFQYNTEILPYGINKGWFEPLDAYYEQLGMNDGLWDDMTEIIDSLEYNGGHYVIPYSLSEPFLLTYSRKTIQAEGLEDPYTLYKSGEWTWDKFVNMMETFVSNAPAGVYRYGINGEFGEAALTSTGHSVVNNENGRLVNNIDDEQIGKAEELIQQITQKGLYRNNWIGHYAGDGSILFFAMDDWSLYDSNLACPELDLMVVPFPKPANSDKYYNQCQYNARMLVKNSQKGEAVATYIKCERLAATDEKCRESAKNMALVSKADGGFITSEQYDAIQEYLTPSSVFPKFDFAYGMGGGMYGVDSSNNGAPMNVLTTAMLYGTYGSWDSLRDAYRDVISGQIDKYNQ